MVVEKINPVDPESNSDFSRNKSAEEIKDTQYTILFYR